MIAITFALPAESSDLVRKIDKLDATIFHTGVGRKSCEHNTEKFFQANQPRLLLSSGFAGAVNNELKVGDLIFGENFSDRDLLLRAWQVLGDRARSAKLHTSTSIVDSIEERDRIAIAHAADAVDMETEVIAQACARRGIPMLSLRVISDTRREPFPAPPQVLFDIEQQRTNLAKLSSHLVRHPASIWRLIRFGRQIARAREALTNAIIDLVRVL